MLAPTFCERVVARAQNPCAGLRLFRDSLRACNYVTMNKSKSAKAVKAARI